jgi:hypothetical protein
MCIRNLGREYLLVVASMEANVKPRWLAANSVTLPLMPIQPLSDEHNI